MRVLVRELIETVILALLIFLTLHLSIGNRRVEGPSMQPTLVNGERVIVNKLVYLNFRPGGLAGLLPFVDSDDGEPLFAFHPPERGDIVVFRYPANERRDFVKRIVAVSGETVVIREGVVFVDGRELEEPYLTSRDRGNMSEVEVPTDSYFVLGDNRRASNDSRGFGAVPFDNIIGQAWISFWPIDRLQMLRALPLP
jgi:signal peptidase I